MAHQYGLPNNALGAYFGVREANQVAGQRDLESLIAKTGLEARLRGDQERTQLTESLLQMPQVASNPALSAAARSNPEALLPLVMPQSPKRVVVPAGGSLVGDDGKPLFTAPTAPAKVEESPLARLVRERNALPSGSPHAPTYDRYIQNLIKKDPTPSPYTLVTGEGGAQFWADSRNPRAPAVPVLGPGGKPVVKPATEKPLTEAQGNATMFGIRAVAMDDTLEKMQGLGYSATGARGIIDRLTAGNLPTNWIASDEGQKYINAGRNFVAAILRKESGAQINETEWKQGQELYIPMPGDSALIIQHKKEARQLAIQGLRESAGAGATRFPAAPPKPDNPPPPAGGGAVLRFDAQGNPVR